MRALSRFAALGSLLTLAVIAASAVIRLGADELGTSMVAMRGIHRACASGAAVLVLLLAWRALRLRVLRGASLAALALMLALSAVGWAAGTQPAPAAALFNQLGGVALAALLAWLAGRAAGNVSPPAPADLALAFAALAFAALQLAFGAALGLLGRTAPPALLIAHATLGVAAGAIGAALGVQLRRAGRARCGAMVLACAACAPLAGIANALPAPALAVQAGHAAAAALLLAALAHARGHLSFSA